MLEDRIQTLRARSALEWNTAPLVVVYEIRQCDEPSRPIYLLHAAPMSYPEFVACRHCDALYRKPRLLARQSALCSRCGSALGQASSARLDRICAITVAALVTFVISQAFPIMELDINGITSDSSLFGALVVLWNENMQLVAAMVFCATTLFPLIEILALLYVLLPLRSGFVPPGFNQVLRMVQFVRPWGMLEVFVLGILVTVVKMVSIAHVTPETSLFAFGILALMLTFVAAFEPRVLWDIAESLRAGSRRRLPDAGPNVLDRGVGAPSTASNAHQHCLTSAGAGLVGCHVCGQLEKRHPHKHHQYCGRCHARISVRLPDSFGRTWALLIAAGFLYLPANLLPIMYTTTLAHERHDTILSGIVHFWLSGEWLIASVIFIASIMVPMLKLSALTLLAFTAQRRSTWRTGERAKLYRIVELIGRWSMLDIFVIALTVSLVRFGSFGVVTAGPGAVAFGLVVILTMMAAMSFDPRLIWDPAHRATKERSQHTGTTE